MTFLDAYNSNLHQDTQFKELELSMFMYGYSHGRVFESSIFLHCQENANHTIYLTSKRPKTDLVI